MRRKAIAQDYYFPDIDNIASHNVKGIKVILLESRNCLTTRRQKIPDI